MDDLNLEDLFDDAPTSSLPDDGLVAGVEPKQTEVSPTALKLDRWSRRRGKAWAEQTEVVADDLENRESFLTDMLATAWEPDPQLADKTDVPHVKHFLEMLMQTPEYASLHRKTRLDMVASEMAATAFATKYIEYKEEDEEDQPDGPGGLPGKPSEEEQLEKDAKALGEALKAVKDATKDVNDLNDMRESLGGDGADPSTMSPERVRDIFKRIRSSRQLRQIMDLAGKYLRLAQSLQHSKPCHGADETVGIEYSDDISRILSSEYGYLDDPDLEDEFLLRFSERSLLSRDVKSTEDEARGPIVLVVDESGSMSGEPIAHAKAMALAVLWVAEHQNRWCCLVGFAGATQGNFLTIPPGQRDMDKLLDWLEHFFGGGTSCDVPLELLPSKWHELGCPAGRTDIIQITDCMLRVPDETVEAFNAWKADHEVKMNTIVIGDEPGDLEQVTDRWWSIYNLDLEAEGVAQCLSV